jgi:hypothetical protein
MGRSCGSNSSKTWVKDLPDMTSPMACAAIVIAWDKGRFWGGAVDGITTSSFFYPQLR